MLRSVDARAFVVVMAGVLLSTASLWFGINLAGNPGLQALWATWVVFVTAGSGAILALFFALVWAVIEKESRRSRTVVFLVLPLVTGLVLGAIIPFLVVNPFSSLSIGFLAPFVLVNYMLSLGAIWVNRVEKGVEQPVDWKEL